MSLSNIARLYDFSLSVLIKARSSGRMIIHYVFACLEMNGITHNGILIGDDVLFLIECRAKQKTTITTNEK